jgi:EAL domain-containing protein (putative c-di-GMP-specific phosphodiesterase class I)
LSFAAQKKPEYLFVRLSRETVRDAAFSEWLDNPLRASRAEPQRLCSQSTEDSAASYVPEVTALATSLRERGFRFAIEGFGSGRDSMGLLESVAARFREDRWRHHPGAGGGSAAAHPGACPGRAARRRNIQTIGERVEDANTMAVLWQLGVQYIQGYFVNEPEEVVLRAKR